MKKNISILLAVLLALALAAGCGTAPTAESTPAADTVEPTGQETTTQAQSAEPEQTGDAAGDITVYVTISDAGTLAAAQAPVAVSDTDGDGALTVNDALTAAHDALYDGGAAAGYAAEEGDYGLAITKLWGVENGGSYGYDINNVGCMNLTDPVADGDYLTAFSYADLTNWSDSYSYFDAPVAQASEMGEVTLTLRYAGYDADFNTVETPVEGAQITVNGEATDFVTAADGSVTISFAEAGTYVVSAACEAMTLVPPVCTVTVA